MTKPSQLPPTTGCPASRSRLAMSNRAWFLDALNLPDQIGGDPLLGPHSDVVNDLDQEIDEPVGDLPAAQVPGRLAPRPGAAAGQDLGGDPRPQPLGQRQVPNQAQLGHLRSTLARPTRPGSDFSRANVERPLSGSSSVSPGSRSTKASSRAHVSGPWDCEIWAKNPSSKDWTARSGARRDPRPAAPSAALGTNRRPRSSGAPAPGPSGPSRIPATGAAAARRLPRWAESRDRPASASGRAARCDPRGCSRTRTPGAPTTARPRTPGPPRASRCCRGKRPLS